MVIGGSYYPDMRHPKDIRVNVLKMTQSEIAIALGRTQPSVCEWERRGAFPVSVLGKLRLACQEKHQDRWQDSWLFEKSEEAK